jgi:hypothetical protein
MRVMRMLLLAWCAGGCQPAPADDTPAPTGALTAASADPLCPSVTVLYLNFNGQEVVGSQSPQCQLDDALTNCSTVARVERATIPPYRGSNAQQMVAHVRRLFRGYNLQVVTERPAAPPYDMVIVGGRGDLIGRMPYETSVSLLRCQGRQFPRIGYVFADFEASDVRGKFDDAAWGAAEVARRVGRMMGLKDVLDSSDVMHVQHRSDAVFRSIALPVDPESPPCQGTPLPSRQNDAQLLFLSVGPGCGPTAAPLEDKPPTLPAMAGAARASRTAGGCSSVPGRSRPWDLVVILMVLYQRKRTAMRARRSTCAR